MFRILFAPKATPGKNEKPILDQVYCKFNTFNIDLEKRELVVALYPNIENGYSTFEDMEKFVTEWWDIDKIEYSFDGGNSAIVRIMIPEGYEVLTVIK
jgi:hypothetical protein